MSNDVLVDLEATDTKYEAPTIDKNLVSWVTELVEPWANHRDTNYKDRWEEYYRLWRGIFKDSDRTRKSERSKLISPALQQAIEATVAEIEEAIFGKGRWFDISQDILDMANPEQKIKLEQLRQQLAEDMDKAGYKSSVSQTVLLGGLYGNGIAKIVTEKCKDYALDEEANLSEVERIRNYLIPVEPSEFLIDPTACTIDESIGCAHETVVPKIDILRKMSQGIYKQVELGETEENKDGVENYNEQGKTKILEYHGLVPESLIPPKVADDEEFEDLEVGGDSFDIVSDQMVEAIVVIANEDKLIKAVKNPLPRGDRAFVSYQHETVPNQFWGRGVAEKGYNPQKALDAELRGRIDAMAYAVHPMMAVDATKIPRGQRFTVEPGKTVLTTGDPRQTFMPFTFGNVNPNSFPQGQDLERMVQMGTGAVDMSQAGAQGMIGSTVGGMGMLTAATIKRTKRTLANIERNFIGPVVQKTAWRYMFFDKENYPIKDMKFEVHSSLGMMAKEIEQQQFMNLMKTVPAESPAYWMLLEGVYENSSISNKDQMLPVIQQMREQAMQPKEPAPDPMVEVTKMDIASREKVALERNRIDLMRVRSELLRSRIAVNKADAEEANLDSKTALNLAKADAEDLNSEIQAYIQEVDSLKEKSTEDNLDESTNDTGEISE